MQSQIYRANFYKYLVLIKLITRFRISLCILFIFGFSRKAYF